MTEGQLLFRDMYFAAQYAIKNYESTVGNDKIMYIPWRLMEEPDKSGKLQTKSDPEAEEYLSRWKSGTTGFPWIDAIQRQLIRDGWIHHLARHSVACFLTRGHLYIDWIKGAQHFEEHLIDHETACNAGNWQWLSCTAFFHQYYRVYSPVAFGKKWDPKGGLIREYVPELKDVPDKFIYEPWKLSKPDQKKYNCVIGQTYPAPMCDLKECAADALSGMKAAYQAKLHGSDPRVMKGTAREYVESLRETKKGTLDKFTTKKRKLPESEDEDNEQDN